MDVKLASMAVPTSAAKLSALRLHARVCAKGRACHSSDPSLGRNAIVLLAKAILDRLAQHRARGHALNINERFEGASGAAVPICDPEGQPHAALNCVTVTPRFLRKQAAIVAALKAAAADIEAEVFGKAHNSSELTA